MAEIVAAVAVNGGEDSVGGWWLHRTVVRTVAVAADSIGDSGGSD